MKEDEWPRKVHEESQPSVNNSVIMTLSEDHPNMQDNFRSV